MDCKDREERIQHAMSFLNDIIPHDDPNYWESLREAAEAYIQWEDDGCPAPTLGDFFVDPHEYDELEDLRIN